MGVAIVEADFLGEASEDAELVGGVGFEGEGVEEVGEDWVDVVVGDLVECVLEGHGPEGVGDDEEVGGPVGQVGDWICFFECGIWCFRIEGEGV